MAITEHVRPILDTQAEGGALIPTICIPALIRLYVSYMPRTMESDDQVTWTPVVDGQISKRYVQSHAPIREGE